MQHQLLKERVNIKKMPTPQPKLESSENHEVTMGDLHGNVITLIFQLTYFGVITNMTAETYEALCDIYYDKQQSVTKDSIKKFKELVFGLQYDTSILARLLGDETCDRGFCDIFQVIKFVHMRQQKVPYEILFSNHGAQFVYGYETRSFRSSGINFYQAKSMYKLRDLVMDETVGDEIYDMINEGYKPALKVMSYTLCRETNTIMLFSHAGIGLGEGDEVIPALTRLFKVEFDDSSIEKLAATIDAINAAFQVYVQANKVRDIYNFNLVASHCTISPKNNPLEFITWNRDYNVIRRSATHPKYGYNLRYCHGHDSNGREEDHVFVLNEWLGNTNFEEDTMAVLTAHSIKPALEPEAKRRPSF